MPEDGVGGCQAETEGGLWTELIFLLSIVGDLWKVLLGTFYLMRSICTSCWDVWDDAVLDFKVSVWHLFHLGFQVLGCCLLLLGLVISKYGYNMNYGG